MTWPWDHPKVYYSVTGKLARKMQIITVDKLLKKKKLQGKQFCD